MAETAIYFDSNDNYGTWFSNHAPGIRKIKAALEKFPNEVVLISDDTDNQMEELLSMFLKNGVKTQNRQKLFIS